MNLSESVLVNSESHYLKISRKLHYCLGEIQNEGPCCRIELSLLEQELTSSDHTSMSMLFKGAFVQLSIFV